MILKYEHLGTPKRKQIILIKKILVKFEIKTQRYDRKETI